MVLWLAPEVFYELDLYLACWLSFCVFGLNLLWLVRGGAVGTLSMNDDVVIFYFLFVSVFLSFSVLWTFVSVSDIGLGFGHRFRTNVVCCEGEAGFCCEVLK